LEPPTFAVAPGVQQRAASGRATFEDPKLSRCGLGSERTRKPRTARTNSLSVLSDSSATTPKYTSFAECSQCLSPGTRWVIAPFTGRPSGGEIVRDRSKMVFDR
jgi:hypothetical protein